MVAGPSRVCSNCGVGLEAGDHFCAACGTRTDRSCTNCGLMLVSGERFCPECQTPSDATGPFGAATHSSAWDSVVRSLRSSLAGEYRITRELGRGGQAAVFLAQEVALDRLVALKVLAPGNVIGEREIELFRREAQTVANLKHAHIVTIYSVRQIDDLHLFVMQYIEGRSLAAIISDRGPLPLTAVRAVAFQIGSALQYAHKRNVIHRDVKPANVLFDEDGNAILTDFGIAKDATQKSNSLALTASMMGTLAYMSPEQCHQHPATWAADQYSLGVLLYEMLTGSVPFDGGQFAVMQGHTDREPPSIRSARADCPVELEWAVMRMLAKRPQERFPSIPEMLTALGAGPLTRDDPIRSELKRLARWSSPGDLAGARKLSIKSPDQLEVGEGFRSEVYSVGPGDAVPQLLNASWSVADSGVAMCDSAGLLKALKVGQSRIIAETVHGKVEATFSVVSPAAREIQFPAFRPTLVVGESHKVTCEVRDRRGNVVMLPVHWSVTEPGVASIDSNGVVNAHRVGNTSVVARAGDAVGERAMFVQEADADSLTIEGGRNPLVVPETLRLTAYVFDSEGRELKSRDVRWTSSDVRIATVDRYGVVRSLSAGSVIISAQSGGAQEEISVSVQATDNSTQHDARYPRSGEAASRFGESDNKVSDSTATGGFWSGGGRVEAQEHEGRDDEGDWPEGAPEAQSSLLKRVSWPRAAVVVGLAVVALVAGRQVSDWYAARQEWKTVASQKVLLGTGTGLSTIGRSIEKIAVNELFTEESADSARAVVNGRLMLQTGTSYYGLTSWQTAARDEFVAHLDVTFEANSLPKEAGLMLRAEDDQFYLVQLTSGIGAAGSFRVTMKSGAGAEVELVPLTPSSSVRRTKNALVVICLDRTMQVYVNGKFLWKSPSLEHALDGQVGVVVAGPSMATFDDLVVATLK